MHTLGKSLVNLKHVFVPVIERNNHWIVVHVSFEKSLLDMLTLSGIVVTPS